MSRKRTAATPPKAKPARRIPHNDNEAATPIIVRTVGNLLQVLQRNETYHVADPQAMERAELLLRARGSGGKYRSDTLRRLIAGLALSRGVAFPTITRMQLAAFVASMSQTPASGRTDAGVANCGPEASGITADVRPLDKSEADILAYLNLKSTVLCTLEDIEGATKISKRTVGKCVTALIDVGLACRSGGSRKGATVTDKGRTVAAKLPAV